MSSTAARPIIEAMCWAHARHKFFDLARLNKAPITIEAIERIDALFAIERDINGKPPPERARVRNERSRPLVTELETWLRKQRVKLSVKNEVAKAITYSLNQWRGLVRFLDDGRLCMSNNAAERALRCLFCAKILSCEGGNENVFGDVGACCDGGATDFGEVVAIGSVDAFEQAKLAQATDVP
jgi:hypothetical protein